MSVKDGTVALVSVRLPVPGEAPANTAVTGLAFTEAQPR